MWPSWILLAVAVAAWQHAAAQTSVPAGLASLIESREREVVDIARGARIALSGTAPCASAVRTCSSCSIDSCSDGVDALPGFECHDDFGTPDECFGEGQRMSKTASAIKLAEGVQITDISTSRNARQDVCATQPLDGVYVRNMVQDTTGNLAWQYFGSSHGVYRFFPGNVWGHSESNNGCSFYDPRIRPWYVAASSGAKNVILILDTSGSMSFPAGLPGISVAQQAAKSVLGTLTNADFFGIVEFSTTATKFRTMLLQATSANKGLGSNFIDRLQPIGSTYYDRSFTAAFDILDASKNAEIGTTSCRTIILFLTDGVPTSPSGTDAVSVVSTRNAAHDAFIFTYSLGIDAATDLGLKEIPHRIACANRGIWSPITNSLDLRSKMTQYYQFLATGLQRDTAVWVEPYEDALGLGMVTTASFPAYDVSTDPATLVGVAGVDVKMADFEAQGSNTQQLLAYLVQRSQSCSGSFNLTECQLEALRGSETCNPTLPCPEVSSLEGGANCSNPAPFPMDLNPFCSRDSYSSSEYEGLACCETSAAPLAAIIGGAAGGVVFVGIFIFVCRRRCRRPPGGKSTQAAAAGSKSPKRSRSSRRVLRSEHDVPNGRAGVGLTPAASHQPGHVPVYTNPNFAHAPPPMGAPQPPSYAGSGAGVPPFSRAPAPQEVAPSAPEFSGAPLPPGGAAPVYSHYQPGAPGAAPGQYPGAVYQAGVYPAGGAVPPPPEYS